MLSRFIVTAVLLAAPALARAQETPGPDPAAPAAVDSLPFIDATRIEFSVRVGYLMFSGDFDADPEPVLGIFQHAPMPWFSRHLLGLEEDRFGCFLELDLSSVSRSDGSGGVSLLAAGLDWTFVQSSNLRIQALLGFDYGTYGVGSLDNGLAILVGAMARLELSDSISISYAPEFLLGQGDWILLNEMGVVFQF